METGRIKKVGVRMNEKKWGKGNGKNEREEERKLKRETEWDEKTEHTK